MKNSEKEKLLKLLDKVTYTRDEDDNKIPSYVFSGEVLDEVTAEKDEVIAVIKENNYGVYSVVVGDPEEPQFEDLIITAPGCNIEEGVKPALEDFYDPEEVIIEPYDIPTEEEAEEDTKDGHMFIKRDEFIDSQKAETPEVTNIELSESKNQLKDLQAKAKKVNKKKGQLGYFVKLDAGNVEHNINMFNHMTNGTCADGSCGSVSITEDYDDEEELVECSWCHDDWPKSDCKYEKDFGWLCYECQEELESRGEELEFEDEFDESLKEELVSDSEAFWNMRNEVTRIAENKYDEVNLILDDGKIRPIEAKELSNKFAVSVEQADTKDYKSKEELEAIAKEIGAERIMFFVYKGQYGGEYSFLVDNEETAKKVAKQYNQKAYGKFDENGVYEEVLVESLQEDMADGTFDEIVASKDGFDLYHSDTEGYYALDKDGVRYDFAEAHTLGGNDATYDIVVVFKNSSKRDSNVPALTGWWYGATTDSPEELLDNFLQYLKTPLEESKLNESSITFESTDFETEDGNVHIEYRWNKGGGFEAGVYIEGANHIYNTLWSNHYATIEQAKAAYNEQVKKYLDQNYIPQEGPKWEDTEKEIEKEVKELDKTITEAQEEDDEKPFTYRQLWVELRDNSNNFKDDIIGFTYGFKQEADMVLDILKKKYKYLDYYTKNDRMFPDHLAHVISASNTINFDEENKLKK